MFKLNLIDLLYFEINNRTIFKKVRRTAQGLFQKDYILETFVKSMTDLKRSIKFAKKISGDSRKLKIDSQKKVMIAEEKKHTIELVKIEIEIKKMSQGQPVSLLPYYIIFGKEIYRRRNIFKSQTLINEIQTLQQKWLSRGLNADLLNNIKIKYIGGFESWKYFELDFSNLDSENRLS